MKREEEKRRYRFDVVEWNCRAEEIGKTFELEDRNK